MSSAPWPQQLADRRFAQNVRSRRSRMTADEKIAKKKLGNPILWAQLDAVSRGTWVNHLGRGHSRVQPPTTQEERHRYGLRPTLEETG
jgi:hypothetical protein